MFSSRYFATSLVFFRLVHICICIFLSTCFINKEVGKMSLIFCRGQHQLAIFYYRRHYILFKTLLLLEANSRMTQGFVTSLIIQYSGRLIAWIYIFSQYLRSVNINCWCLIWMNLWKYFHQNIWYMYIQKKKRNIKVNWNKNSHN